MKTSKLHLVLCAYLAWLPVITMSADPSPKTGERQPVHIEADRIDGHSQQEIEATGKVRMRQGDQTLTADRVKYYQDSEDVEVEGNAQLDRPDDTLWGTYLQMNLNDDTGQLSDPRYLQKDGSGRGSGEQLLLEGKNQYRFRKARYTTCPEDNHDWYILADDLEIDNGTKVATARHVSVRFKDVPILYVPWMNFSFGNERKTGFLSPIMGNTSRSGAEVSVPFYWNIAPNYDATITPRIMSRRGVMLNNEFRYIGQTLNGRFLLDYLPNDLATDTTRYGMQLNHFQNLGAGWFGMLNYNSASDRNYFRDLGNNIMFTSQTNLLQQGFASYFRELGRNGMLTFSTLVQQFQTLQDPRAPIISPYKILPRFTLNAAKTNVYGLDFDFASSFTHFSHPTLPHGLRVTMLPGVSLPLENSFGFIRPRVSLHHTRYDLNEPANLATDDRHLNRTVPIFSFDSGVVLERDTSLQNENFVQTIEPRVFYTYIPYRNQRLLPNFDSAEMDFSYPQLFLERRFSGEDRINDANEITLAVSSRLIHSATGNERLRLSVGQKIRFSDRRVVLTSPQVTRAGSDFIAELSGSVTSNIKTDTGIQLNQNNLLVEKIRSGVSYRPAPGQTINAGYRFTRDVLKQVDLSTQWSFLKNWQGLAAINYSLKDDKLLVGLLGVEYNACCWSLRLVTSHFATATQSSSTNFFVQLELNDLMRIGSDPMRVLQQTIPGYIRTDL
ncbi:LPS-assembly protein LptD [Betaproteobacteria bacterium PRO4]|uniref:LPS-assembly protein LptD n=1 Tax=Nitrosomonas sp. TaxID=42353 RepID=UPI0025699692|nr:LPS-assembly protein LptD [Nitrosomonas sp.]MBE7526325.1 LPS-assembly protein LptD [Burkholderiales bacterium]MDL1866571.1 LPS-assembly protein LptD [Betaproteobacteria bacterium PRO4]